MTIQLDTVKVSLVGAGQVGKSTIRSMLEDIGAPTKPTIGIDIGKYQDNEMKCALFDLGGQERFQALWNDFVKGSNLVCLVTDSTEQDVKKAKEILDRLDRRQFSKIIAIANKQDEAGKLNAEQVQRILNVKTYPMVAIDRSNKEAMVNIIKENL